VFICQQSSSVSSQASHQHAQKLQKALPDEDMSTIRPSARGIGTYSSIAFTNLFGVVGFADTFGVNYYFAYPLNLDLRGSGSKLR
jgi:hypothetical protein